MTANIFASHVPRSVVEQKARFSALSQPRTAQNKPRAPQEPCAARTGLM